MAMVADVMVIVPKHPIIDQARGAITGWRAGKVKPGDKTDGRFMWRGPLHEAPSGAHCEKPEDQVRLEDARRAWRDKQQQASLAKKAEAAAMAAHAAASIFRDTPQAQQRRQELAEQEAPAAPRKGWPKGKKRERRAPAVGVATSSSVESEPAAT